MDKVRREHMLKKAALIFIVAVFMATVYGCEATKSATTALKNADDWMQKNLW
jgi:hypothetical protein